MNVFLTGEINCGKSTIIKQFINEYKGKTAGYKTIRIKTSADKFFGIYLLDINDSDENANIENKAGDCFIDKSLKCYENVFNTLGVSLLEKHKEADLVVMDEIGVLEKNCEPFKKSIIDCLDSKKNVLGVIKKRDTEFLNSIRNREDTIIIEVTGSNNAEVVKQLKQMYSL